MFYMGFVDTMHGLKPVGEDCVAEMEFQNNVRRRIKMVKAEMNCGRVSTCRSDFGLQQRATRAIMCTVLASSFAICRRMSSEPERVSV